MLTLALHLAADVASQVMQCPPPPPGVTLPEAVLLGICTAAISVGAAWGATRAQHAALERRVDVVERTTATVPAELARLNENLVGLRRELHASGAIPRGRGEG